MRTNTDAVTGADKSEAELRACPLCPDGGKPYFTRSVNGSKMAYVGCSQCGLELKAMVIMVTPVDEILSKDIITIWNTRPAPAEPPLAALNAAREVVRKIDRHFERSERLRLGKGLKRF